MCACVLVFEKEEVSAAPFVELFISERERA